MTYAFALLCIAITIPIIIRETRKSRQDATYSEAYGDHVFVPRGLRSSFHSNPNGTEG